ncbi:MAG: (Fe-S)-binding protein [Ignavibacteriaceae bacterium]
MITNIPQKPKQNTKLLNVLPNDDVLSQCIHCGMCLSTCPTYEMTKLETSSPRGRIKLIKSFARGEMLLTEAIADEMYFCLDCQACETACPAGVKYGSMVEAARAEVDSAGLYGSVFGRFIKRISLKYIIAYRFNLKAAAKLLYFYQVSGLQKFLHSIGFFKLVSERLGEIDSMSPKVSSTFSSSVIKEVTFPEGEEKNRTAFLTGCLMDVMFADINKDTIEVLAASGSKVFTPKNQVCCGSLHAHNGDFETAKKLAKKNIDIFNNLDYDYLVSNSAGCGAFMKEYGQLLADDSTYSEKAKMFSAKVKDLTEFLVETKAQLPLKEINNSAAYHDACHLVHAQKITIQPRAVLQLIPGLKLKTLNESSWCCGSAGIYNVMRYDDSMVILKRKMENIGEANVEVVITGNPGCISQIQYGAKKFNVNVEVVHPATLLKKSIQS